MFYKEDLQSAINEAVRESKLVACFVTDNGEESLLWENDFLSDHRVRDLLSERTVLLRLEAGSKEAGFLAAIFPLPKSPTFVIIQNGQLKEYLTSGVPRDKFLERLLLTFNAKESQPSASLSSRTLPEVSSRAETRTQLSTQIPVITETSKPNPDGNKSETTTDVTAGPSSENPVLQQVPIDPRYALIQKKRLEDKDERARILKLVEEDKESRRCEAARRKEEREHCSTTSLSRNTTLISASSHTSKKSSGETSSLLIRLFDGSVIRNKFSSTATLADDVRNFISQHHPALSDQPYVFKHVLSPLPNHTIETAEENRSLQDLDCVPSATLILAPIKAYTEAYSNKWVGSTAGGLIEGVVNSGWGIVSGGFGMVTGALGAIIGGSVVHDRSESSQRNKSCDNSTPNKNLAPQQLSKMRTIEKKNHTDEQQFYNGNSVNFQPRPKDNDDEDDKNE